jgi:hypothetical protein
VLERQRENLKKKGLLLVIIVTEWKFNELKISRITIENFAVTINLDISKLKEKIKKWWISKLIPGIKNDSEKSYEKMIKRRLKLLLLDHFETKIEIKLEEFLVLIY